MSILSDFDWSWRGIRVRETGAEIPFNLALLKDVWRGGYMSSEKLFVSLRLQYPLRCYIPPAHRALGIFSGAV